MDTTRVLVWLKPVRSNASNHFFYENRNTEEGFLVRAPRGRLPDGIEVIAARLLVDTTGAVQRFMEFLQQSVRRVPGGRLSRRKIWMAWAEMNNSDSSSREIGGVFWSEVPELFRTVFDAGDLGWQRLDGDPQRVWEGFEISEAAAAPPEETSAPNS